MNPVALLLGGGWRYLAIAALIVGAYAWLTSSAYKRGVRHERAVWTLAATRAAAAAADLAQRRAAQVADADTARARRAQAYAARRSPIANEVLRYVQTPVAAAVCPDLHGVQLGQAAIDAANAATAAAR